MSSCVSRPGLKRVLITTTPVRNTVPLPSLPPFSINAGPSLFHWTSDARSAFVNRLVRSVFGTGNPGRVVLSRDLRESVARRLLQCTEEAQFGPPKTRSPPSAHAPFLGLVGLGLASSENGIVLTEEEEYDGLCSKFRVRLLLPQNFGLKFDEINESFP